MNPVAKSAAGRCRAFLLTVGVALFPLPATAGADASFEGAHSTWHDGFARFDYLMDDETLDIQPFQRGTDEGLGIKDPPPGKHRGVVIVPKQPAFGNPWSWRGCYWNHQPQVEVELLHRGFHVAYLSANATLKPGKHWEAWYTFLTEKHALAKKPAFIGMSRGGEYSYIWATDHPSKVACIYADNPGVDPDILKKLGVLAAADVPLLQVCGSIDPLLARSAGTIETIYQQYGGRVSVMIQEGKGHHPHSLRDPQPIADFIAQSVQPVASTPPAYLSGRISKSWFYSLDNAYRYFPHEGIYITCRGPWFTECYERYAFELKGVAGAITVIVPRKAAPGKPWTFRADSVSRDATVDLALLARGFHLVTGPVPYNGDGPSLQHWNAVYQMLTEHGFSKKPVLEGAGGAAGEAYAWAIANPDKVRCIYAENPVLHCTMTKAQPLDNLAVLAKAGIPLLHVCGSLDPMLQTHTRTAEARCKELGAVMTVIIQEGIGHYPTAPRDPTPVVDFILRQQESKPANPKSTPSETHAKQATRRPPDYQFDKTISQQVLENYLSRAITMEGMLNGKGDLDANVRMLKDIGAKFIGRALCLWAGEANLLKNLERAKQLLPRVHQVDPDMILQACIFEIVTTNVERVPVPPWAFAALNRPVEKRNFRYADMLYPDGKRRNHWGQGASVPDISRLETKLWFYFLAASYIDLGMEAIHFGQIELMNRNDPNLEHCEQVLDLMRAYAAKHARRHLVLCDAHVPSGGLVREGRLLLDFHSFPLRIKEIPDHPQEACLQVGFSDSIYGRSKGGLTYSGWKCEHLPYLVEIDNWGVSRQPGQAKQGGIWIWGYDEISWFANQSKEYRADWLRYAWDWVRTTDPNGYLQMPGSRTVRSPLDRRRWYFANTPSVAVPDGLGDEGAIKAIWAAASAR